MRLSSSKKWIALRQEFYLSLRAQVERRIGFQKGEILTFQNQYEKDLSGGWKITPTPDFIKRIQESQLILLADFHALQQSQKAHLRILRKCNPKNVVLVLECFYASHQKYVDRFMSGEMAERDFLKAVEWKKSWGFAWQHYKPLLKWAMAHRIPVYGANLKTTNDDPKALYKRDVFAAQVIAEVINKHQDQSVFVQFGDLHLAKTKLPTEIRKRTSSRLKMIRVF
ncbi:MAG: ChaN family lipoprotein, partial [Pseudobdellovibrionaceae bacterium]